MDWLQASDTVRAAGGGSAGGGTRLTTAAAISAALGTVQKGAERSTPSEEAPQISRSAGYFPGTADAALAEFFTLAAGEERTGVDIRNALVRSSRLEGSVVGPNGQPLQHVLVGLANLSTGGLWASPGFVRPGADGRFSMASITPGRYAFFGRGTDANINPTPATPDASLPLWTWTEVTVKEQDLVDVVMQFLPGAAVSGRLVFDESPAGPRSGEASALAAGGAARQRRHGLESVADAEGRRLVANSRACHLGAIA